MNKPFFGKRPVLTFVFVLCGMFCAKAQILVEAESFSNKGGWVIDQQFMDLMGSPYLLAHGMGTPVEDALTEIHVSKSGTYHVWVRTYNWTSPWTDKEGPGAFSIKVGDETLNTILGTKGNVWMWQKAGKIDLKKGPVTLSLSDLTGFDGRCDAIYLTKDATEIPPSDSAGLAAMRRKLSC